MLKILALLALLDTMADITVRVIVLALTGFVGFGVFWFILVDEASKASEFWRLLTLLDENWKAMLTLMVLAFYRQVRKFLEDVTEVWGMKRPPRQSQEPQPPPNPNDNPSGKS